MSNVMETFITRDPFFANQYCSSEQRFSDGVSGLLYAPNLLSFWKQISSCPVPHLWPELPGGTQYLSWAREMWPCSLWVASVFVCGFFTKQKRLFFVLFWIRGFFFFFFTKSSGLVHCDIFQYTLLSSQSLLGKVSWGNQNLLLSLWNSEIKATLQNNRIVINVVCRLVTQSIGQ